MERKEKNSLNRRLLMIYVGYFIIIGAGFLHSYLPTFKWGFMAGVDAAQQEIESSRQGIEKRWYLFPVKSALYDGHGSRLDTGNRNVEVEVSAYDALATVTVCSADPDNDAALHMVTRNYRKAMAASIGLSLSWLAILVLIGVIINSLRRSIHDQRTLSDSNILYMRIIGGLIIINELLEAASYHFGQKAVTAIVGDGIKFISSYPIEYGGIVLGLLVLFSAEVYVIGATLSEEQKLTI